jgi:hypothetical protein
MQARSFIAELENLMTRTWLFIKHPPADHPEMDGVHHPGYEHVRGDRASVTRVLTEPAVVQAILDLGIQLITYRDLTVWAESTG